MPTLYDFDRDKLYVAMMRRLSLPLPSGKESPFSSQAPGTAQAILTGAMIQLQEYIAHELNLAPYLPILQILRMMGVEFRASEYPIINMVFQRSSRAINAKLPLTIPAGTQIRSNRQSELKAITLYPAFIEGADTKSSVSVQARLSVKGRAEDIQNEEFTLPPTLISNLFRCYNNQVISQGRSKESLPDAAKRGLEMFQTGKRAITASDYLTIARREGNALKAQVLPGLNPDDLGGSYADLVTVLVWDETVVTSVREALRGRTAHRYRVYLAKEIKVSGTIKVKALPELSDNDLRNLVARTIRDQVNPPQGFWGDKHIRTTLGNALERTRGIWATPIEEMKLYDIESGNPVETIDPYPWNLWVFTNGLKVERLETGH